MSRWLAAPAAVLLALLMGWWAWASSTGIVGYRGVATMADGAPVVLSLVRVESIDAGDRYTVSSGATLLDVVGPTTDLAIGEDVTIGGNVAGGRVVQAWREPAPSRGDKRLLGVMGLVAAALLVPFAVRREPGGLALRG